MIREGWKAKGRWLPPRWLARASERLRASLLHAHRRSTLAPVAVLELAMGAWLSQGLYVAAELGLADVLADGPRNADELARALSVDAVALRRLLGALCQYGVFAQKRDGRFALTKLSESLRVGPESLRDYVLFVGHPAHRLRWSSLTDAVRKGAAGAQRPGGEDLFEQLTHDRELGEVFDRAMTSLSRVGSEALLAVCDFRRFGTIVDVGGGRGANLAAILRAAPQSRGVLFDLPAVTAGAPALLEQLGLRARVQVESGSFFERVPSGADAYVLKHVLHDWSDERALAILRVVRAAIAEHGRLLVMESVLPEGPGPHLAKLIDLEMMVIGGRERTAAEFAHLLRSAGFAIARITPTAGPVSLIEARTLPTNGSEDGRSEGGGRR